MAQKFVGDVTRRDMFFADPHDVRLDDALRGRVFVPTEEQIIDLAVSMFDHQQQQPIVARRKPDGTLHCVAGFTRSAAARLIKDGFKDSEGKEYKDPAFKLKVVLTDANDEKSFVSNVVENAMRNETSPIDDAYNQNRLRETYGKSDVEIARLYGDKTSVKVGRLRQLLSLERNEQFLVHTKVLGVDAAINLLQLPSEERKKIIDELEAGAKVTGEDIRNQVRDHHLADSDNGTETAEEGTTPATNEKKRAAPPLNIKLIRKFLVAEMELPDADENTVEFYKTMLQWVNGKRTNKSMANAMMKLVESCSKKKEKKEKKVEEAA